MKIIFSNEPAPVTEDELAVLRRGVLRLQKAQDLSDLADEDIAEFGGIESTYRWKPSRRLRQAGGDVRIVFRLTPKGEAEIIAAGSRDNVYKV